MPSSSSFSDIRPEQITAREEHHRRNGAPPSDPKESVDSTKYLDSIGAHFHLPNKQESWPKSIEDLTDDEATSWKPDVTRKTNGTSLYPWSDSRDSPPDGSTPTPTRARTPTQGGPYLPPSEMEEFRRQRPDEQASTSELGHSGVDSPTRTRQSSPYTTAGHGTHDGEPPQPRSRAHTMFSPSHTPSHRSLDTADEDNRGGEGPSSPCPWSPYDQKSSKVAGSHKG
ncbi:Nn.00g098230.m01.CDS01 [Neocucurbitaria sp. VM-36]